MVDHRSGIVDVSLVSIDDYSTGCDLALPGSGRPDDNIAVDPDPLKTP